MMNNGSRKKPQNYSVRNEYNDIDHETPYIFRLIGFHKLGIDYAYDKHIDGYRKFVLISLALSSGGALTISALMSFSRYYAEIFIHIYINIIKYMNIPNNKECILNDCIGKALSMQQLQASIISVYCTIILILSLMISLTFSLRVPENALNSLITHDRKYTIFTGILINVLAFALFVPWSCVYIIDRISLNVIGIEFPYEPYSTALLFHLLIYLALYYVSIFISLLKNILSRL